MLQELQLSKITLFLLLLTGALYPFLFSSDLAMASQCLSGTAVHLLTPEVPECFLLQMCSVYLFHCWMKSWGEGSGSLSQKVPREWTWVFKSLPCISCLPCTPQCGLNWWHCQCEGWYCWAWVMEWLWLYCACGVHFQSRQKCCRSSSCQSGVESTAGDVGHGAVKALCSLAGAAEALKLLWPIRSKHLGAAETLQVIVFCCDSMPF